jgi:hypothetical protein
MSEQFFKKSVRFGTVLTTIVTASFVTLLGIMVSYGAWTDPVSAPPQGNVSAPINVGSALQQRIGPLVINTGGALVGLSIPQGNVGIGTLTPSEKLEVVGGNVQFEGNLTVLNDIFTGRDIRASGDVYAQNLFHVLRIPSGAPPALQCGDPTDDPGKIAVNDNGDMWICKNDGGAGTNLHWYLISSARKICRVISANIAGNATAMDSMTVPSGWTRGDCQSYGNSAGGLYSHYQVGCALHNTFSMGTMTFLSQVAPLPSPNCGW